MITADRFLDNAFVKAFINGGDHPGAPLAKAAVTRDGKTYDSTGAFLVGELERLDQTLHMPLQATSWERDLPIRTDMTVADEVLSFTQSTFGIPSGTGSNSIGQKRSVISQTATQVPEVAVDIDAVKQPTIAWGEGMAFSLHELAAAAQIGRPIDAQKMNALNLDYQLQMDAQAYLGWQGNSTYGLINSPAVQATNLPATGTVTAGVGTASNWPNKTPAQILTDLTNMVYTPWAASGFAVRPNRILLDPQNLTYIQVTPVTTAGSASILTFFLESFNAQTGSNLEIRSLKWCIGAGSGGTLMQQGTINRAVVYHQTDGNWQQSYVRYPMVGLQRTPIQFDGLWHKTYLWGRLAACEFVYPETVAYFDGL